MRTKRRFSIRYKFLGVTTLLLVLCVGAYLFMATHVFRKDKSELVFDLNRSFVSHVAQDLDTIFSSATDKMRLAAYFFHSHDEKNLKILSELMATSSDIVFVGGSEDFKSVSRQFFENPRYIETYGLPADFFSREASAEGLQPIPFSDLQKEGEAIWEATTAGGPPLIGFGKSVVLEDANGRPTAHYAVVAYLRADRILKSLSRTQMNIAAITGRDGRLIVHSERKKLSASSDEFMQPLVTAANREGVASSVLRYVVNGQEFLGAFAKAANSRLIVFSRVSADEAFSVVERFLRRALVVAMMILTLAFIAAIMFSRSLTHPLDVLTSGMARVSEGELATQIQVNSRDEIAELADSFNHMIRDLKASRTALEDINRDLEKKVHERTVQLERQNQAVKSTQEALLRTTRLAAVGEIAGRAAHEVLNPLTTIIARLERMQTKLQSSENEETQFLREMVNDWQKAFQAGGWPELIKQWQAPSQVGPNQNLWQEDLANLNVIAGQMGAFVEGLKTDALFLQQEAQRISRIVQSMRGLTAVNSVKKVYRLSDLTAEAADIMRDLASQFKIEIRVARASEGDEVFLDRDEFFQALTNMIRNSIQAVQQRRKQEPDLAGWIEMRVGHHEDSRVLDLKDNGCGISDADKLKLFETQFSTKPKEEGTGLGLNISRRFLRAVGGDINLIWSQSGEGAHFRLSLPAASENQKLGAA